MNKQKIAKTQDKVGSDKLHVISSQELGLSAVAQSDVTVGFSTWVRALMQNWRQGTLGCKGRSDVSFSNKKPWKQKGTGRARAGSSRSPVWRSGGVSHGPQPRVRTLQVNKQVKKNVLASLASHYANAGKIVSLDWTLSEQRPKTAEAFNVLKEAGLKNVRINLFLPVSDVLSFASFANIPNVRILFFDQANAFDMSNSDHWVFLKKDFDHFKNMVSQWL
ncbi:MAG: 50S ribosomal protein L4 [Candidatus Dependentiae bacterium]|nr:50S ribosomal protein L4 [Candidatus Dependentiae bacterium]